MLMAFSDKNKAGFLRGSIQKPRSQANLLSAWECNNGIIASWILNSISEDIVASIVDNGSVKEVWDELPNHVKQENGTQIYQLHKELVTTRQGTQSIEVYYTKLKTIWQY